MPALFALQPRPRLTLVEAPPDALAAQLAARSLHFVLADAEPATGLGLHSRVLLESPVALFAPPALARKLRKDFPSHLAGAPVIISPAGPLRREVERWIAQSKQPVRMIAEVPHPESLALSAGAAVFAPWLLRDSLKTAHGLLPVGELAGTRWRAFAITAGRGVKHPALDAIVALARRLH
jgi:hypothetical protein